MVQVKDVHKDTHTHIYIIYDIYISLEYISYFISE